MTCATLKEVPPKATQFGARCPSDFPSMHAARKVRSQNYNLTHGFPNSDKENKREMFQMIIGVIVCTD